MLPDLPDAVDPELSKCECPVNYTFKHSCPCLSAPEILVRSTYYSGAASHSHWLQSCQMAAPTPTPPPLSEGNMLINAGESKQMTAMVLTLKKQKQEKIVVCQLCRNKGVATAQGCRWYIEEMATAVSIAKTSQTLKTNICKLIQTNVYLQNYTHFKFKHHHRLKFLALKDITGDKKIHLSNKD